MAKPTLFQQLCTESTLYQAWKEVRAKNASGGVDGVTVSSMEEQIGEYFQELIQELKVGKWMPHPYLRVEIPKKKNEKRQLGLLSVKDKIVQQAIKNLIEPYFERIFVNNNYGYRPNKGHTKAVRRAQFECQAKKHAWVVRIDIDNYFDTIHHETLFNYLHALIPDEEIVRLVQLCVKMGVVTKRLKWDEVMQGVPQGAVLSPLLANLYLHPFDMSISTQEVAYVRYADDFIILCETREQAERLLQRSSEFLTTRLKLALNEPCISETKDGIEFLGVTIDNKGLSLSPKKKEELLEKINTITLHEGSFTSKSLQSWRGIRTYYGTLLPQPCLVELDQALVARVQLLIQQFIKTIPNRSILARGLCEIEFLSEEMQLHRKKHHNALIDFYLLERGKGRRNDIDQQNKKIIRQRKLEYRKKEGEGTELVINTIGAYVGLTNKGISVKLQGKVIHKCMTNTLKHITIMTKGVSLSSNMIQFCLENKITIDFFDPTGKHHGSILSPKYVESTLWDKQATLPVERRYALAMRIILGKLKNQINLIKYFHKYHKTAYASLTEKYADTIRQLDALVSRLKTEKKPPADYTQALMGYEAQGALLYWGYIRELLADDKVGFEKRERQGATDLVNSMLNYAYALLYTRVWQALLGAKLNPTDSVLHARQGGKPTFAYDVVEIFRAQAADRVVISLIQKGLPVEMRGGKLEENTKKNLTKSILERMNRYEKYRGEEMKFEEIIRKQAREIAQYIRDGTTYRPYIAKW
jgi:group II intron reverse transcriptase/maturase/CRISPR-associated endonuclease Cas1